MKVRYKEEIREAANVAYQQVVGQVIDLLVISAASPIPKDTGYLRSQTNITMNPSSTGWSLILSWPGVPYARHLIEHAGVWRFRHPADPAARGDFPVPALDMVYRLFLMAFTRELRRRGIQHEAPS